MPRPNPNNGSPLDPSALEAAARADPGLAQVIRKLANKQPLTRDDQRLWRAFQKQRDHKLRWHCYHNIPQKDWREMSGRQTKVINEQAARYGIPFGGAFIDLPAVVRGLHDFLAENAIKLARDQDPLMGDAPSPALEQYRAERARLAKMDREEREGVLLPRDKLRDGFARIAGILRITGEAVQKQYGSGASDLLYEALSDAQREIDLICGEGDAAERPEDPAQ